MARLQRHVQLGVRWLTCGQRLFARNPWLLGGMGLTTSVLITLLWALPLLGGPLIALMAPILLGSFSLAIERISKLNMPLPAVLRRAAFKQSPRELLLVFRDERRILPIAVVCLVSMFVSVLTNMTVWLIAGSAWTQSWISLGVSGWLSVIGAIVFALAVYFLLAAAMVYALPRTFLRDKALVPEVVRSLKASVHYVFALITVFAVLLLPLALGAVASLASPWLAYALALLVNALTLPLVACALFCSYLAVFQPRRPVAAHA